MDRALSFTDPLKSQNFRPKFSRAPLFISRALASKLLKFYDYPHPFRPNVLIKGYDKAHAFRTARMCAVTAQELQHPSDRVTQYQIACLLHDLGRAGLDQQLFGRIWSWAKHRGIPTRPREWRATHPNTAYGCETHAFLLHYGNDLEEQGIPIDPWTREQVEMRLGFARRLRKQLRSIKPELKELGVKWASWMEQVMLYYYYPEKLEKAKHWVHQLAEILVACEQLEAYSNNQRGRDYYGRKQESFVEAFQYLGRLQQQGIITRQVFQTVKCLTAQGAFDAVLKAARGRPISIRERRYLQSL